MTASAVSRRIVACLGIALLLALAACTSTRARRGTPEQSGFLGDYSQLESLDGYPMALVYINPDANFPRYDSIHIDSVTLWVNEEKHVVSEDERQMLTDTLFLALHDELGQYFELTDEPSPSTIRLRAALTQAKGAKIALRTLTTLYPQARVLATAASLPTDVAYTVGTATVEIEAVDSVTGERLGASVDERSGNKALLTLRTFQKWGDFEAACRFWARRVAFRAAKYGVRRKPDTEMPDPSGRRTL